jgi:hypothetical protein
MTNRKGQVAIWVIVALVIVVSVGILLIAGGKKNLDSFVQETYDVEPYIERCARQAVRGALTEILPQGGFAQPKNYRYYQGKNVTYLCENIGHFEPCINQHPMLLEEIKSELQKTVESEIDSCFLELQDVLTERNTATSLGPLHTDISLGPGQARLDIERQVTLEDRGTKRVFERFDVVVAHPAYDLIQIANEIASQEAKYCYFEYVGYMVLYPQFDIQKVSLSDSTKIYTITDTKSEEAMRIAIRSCAIPPGI